MEYPWSLAPLAYQPPSLEAVTVINLNQSNLAAEDIGFEFFDQLLHYAEVNVIQEAIELLKAYQYEYRCRLANMDELQRDTHFRDFLCKIRYKDEGGLLEQERKYLKYHETVVNLIEDYESMVSAFWKAVQSSDYARIERFINDKGISLTVRDSDGRTPLHHAVINRSSEIVKLLIYNNTDVINTQDKYGNTPLDYVKDSVIENLLRQQGARTRNEDDELIKRELLATSSKVN